jgi:predicted amidophosphoribosyltransferase
MSLLSEIEFGSFLTYSPSGKSETSQRSRRITDAVKNDGTLRLKSSGNRVQAIPFLVKLLKDKIGGSDLRSFFREDSVLVPAPRSSPIAKSGLYPSKIICQHLVEFGLGKDVQVILERTKAVPKAAFQKNPDDRPTIPQHYASMRIQSDIPAPSSIILVDDVITSGAMSIASASRIKDAFPDSNVQAFALIRTMSGIEVDDLINICFGTIKMRSADRSSRVP